MKLPDELLGRILRRACADRPPRPAAEEVRCAADLASVCRRVRELLRAQPLPLALDFSAARMSAAQRSWLLEPAQSGRVEAAKFFVNFEEEDFEDALWERQPVLDEFLARHGGMLLHLSGVPLRLVARVSQKERPALDLSGLRLIKLGIDCSDIVHLFKDDGTRARLLKLWPECLPGTLEELELLGLCDESLSYLAWAPGSGAGLAGRLPHLHTLRLTTQGDGKLLSILNAAIFEGFASLPHVKVAGLGTDISVRSELFERVRSLRIEAGADSGVGVFGDRADSVAVFVDRLCSAGLQAAELGAELIGVYFGSIKYQKAHEVVCKMISRCENRFAVEVGVAEDPDEGRESPGGGRWDKARLRRLAWRHWPAPDAPNLPAARAAHERARAWAAERGQQQPRQ